MEIKRPKNFFGEDIPLTVFISEEQLHNKECIKVYGKYFEDTGIFNVFPNELSDRGEYLGDVLPEGSTPSANGFCGVINNDEIEFYWSGEKIVTESYGLYQSIFSRNKGILETDVMKKKCAVIIGCGSVGSLVAMELARAGVEKYVLCDADTLEYHNVCRHQCGIEDVGDLKVNALKRKILNINPKANVKTFGGIIQNIPKEILDEMCTPYETIFVGCGDNRTADVYANKIAIYFDAAFISIGFWERAYAGEIFYHIPHKNMPCYKCALGSGDLSGRVEANHRIEIEARQIRPVRREIRFAAHGQDKFDVGIDVQQLDHVGNRLHVDAVDDCRPRLNRPRRRLGMVGVDGNLNFLITFSFFLFPFSCSPLSLSLQRLDFAQHRLQPRPLLVPRERRRAGPRRFTAEVENVRPLVDVVRRAAHRLFGTEELAAVRKRIRRDVDDAHDLAVHIFFSS